MSASNISTYTFQQLESTADLDQSPEELLGRARRQADAIREQARAEGEAAGREAGLAQARAQAEPLLAALAQAVEAVGDTREELIEKLTRQAGEVSLLIAEQVVAGAFEVQPERVLDVIRAAMRRLGERHRITIRVSPDDLDLATDAVHALQTELGGVEHLDVQTDTRIAHGGAIAQTSYGEIDATIEEQLRAARELVRAALAGDSAVAAADGEAEVVDAEVVEPTAGDTSGVVGGGV